MKHKIVVVGGAGAMGQIIVRDLATFFKDSHIVIADFDLARAKALAKKIGIRKASAAAINVTDIKATSRVLNGAFAVINGAPYAWNLHVMEAALLAKCHYIDLGGLFHMTRKQLKLSSRFAKIGKLALLGMGAAPGITNILASVGAEWLDKVTEIHLRLGSRDLSKYRNVPALPISYSLQTILEEFSFEPAIFTKGKFKFIDPLSGAQEHSFPKPVGTVRPFFTLHSEVATLPLTYKGKGAREVSFKIAFDEYFIDRVRFLRDMGFASHEEISIRGKKVLPIEVANRVATAQKPAERVGRLKQFEVVRAVVKGVRQKKKTTILLDCITTGMPKWNLGTDINTGCPPAIAAYMLAQEEITAVGALPPELTVPPDLFFSHLAKRNMKVTVRKVSGWGFKV